MGQYFIAVNCTRQEYFTAWELGGVAKLWEWCASPQVAVFAYLLRKSDDSGGGDIPDPTAVQYAGRWAGEEVYLVGDYDSSGLYQTAQQTYRNIAQELVAEYNQFIQLTELQLPYQPPEA